jgi:electron transport complex protein RnfC
MKAAVLRRPIRVAPVPREATLPLLQGEWEATPLVRPGEHVLTGQAIGRDELGTVVHASITGTVVAVECRPVPSATARAVPCVVIRQEGAEEFHASCEPVAAALLSPDEIRARVAAGGIVGLGGALFPTAVKLAAGVPIRALIVNGVECEPWITCDEMLIRERAASVISGTRIMMLALGAGRAVIAVEADMPEARVALDDTLRAAGDFGVGIAVVTAKYPAGGERQLIELITGDEVPSGGLPRDIGYVCHNVGTAAAVASLFQAGRPLISRIVTVTGGGIAEPGNFEARIGTPIRDLVELAGGYRDEPRRLIMGGPMMGLALHDDALPVTKATNCIVAASPAEITPARPEMPCIRCGECIQACPARLLPQELFNAARHGDVNRLEEFGLADCIECGCCDYVCPSNIALTVRFTRAKALLHEQACSSKEGRG